MTVAYDEILADLKNKSFSKIVANIKELTARLNEGWTDYLQDRIDFGNKYLLKGFQYRLVMEEV